MEVISTRYLLISLITRKYLLDMILIYHFRSGWIFGEKIDMHPALLLLAQGSILHFY
jgi:hypothetical protein